MKVLVAQRLSAFDASQSRSCGRPQFQPWPLIVLFAVVTLGAFPSFAQATLQQHRLSEVSFNKASCDDSAVDVLLDIDITNLNDPPYVYREMLVPWTGSGTEVNCPDYLLAEPVFDVVPEQALEPVSGRFLQTFTLRTRELLGEQVCEESGERRTDLALCLYVVDALVDTVIENGIALRYDTEAPVVPQLEALEPGDGTLEVIWSSGTDAGAAASGDTVLVQYRSCAALDGGTPDSAVDAGTDNGVDTAGGTPTTTDAGVNLVEAESICDSPVSFTEKEFSDETILLSGLENGVAYEVRIRLKDDFANEGEASAALLGTPRPQLGPMELYDGAGSPYSFTPSCAHLSAADGSELAALAIFLFLLPLHRNRRRSRYRFRCGSLLTGAIVLVSAAANAEIVDGSKRSRMSDENAFSVGVTIGPYAPNLDAEEVDGVPVFPIYDCFFENQLVPETGVQVGWRSMQAIGTLELNFGASFAQMRGQGQPVAALSAASSGNARCLEPASGNVELTVLKLKPALSYRFTPLLQHFGLPFVPYARVGAVLAGYGFSSAGQWDTATDASASQNPAGLIFGYEAALGVQLSLSVLGQLDPFTPYTTQRARANGIFDDAFLFAEVYAQPLDNFGSTGLIFSPQDRVFQTGLPISMNFGLSMDIP